MVVNFKVAVKCVNIRFLDNQVLFSCLILKQNYALKP